MSLPQLFHPSNKVVLFTALSTAVLITTGCQSTKTANATYQPSAAIQGQAPQSGQTTQPSQVVQQGQAVQQSQGQQAQNQQPQTSTQAQRLESFTINGKMGITTPATATRASKSTSAFYVWGQQSDRFAIELMGALGLGKTNIQYNGQTATLVSEDTGTISAANPETLLRKATGLQAPISQLPYWISGSAAPSDSAPQVDAQGRLVSAVNANWRASLSYDNNESLPNKIVVTQPQGHRVVMTIMHQNR